MNRCHKCGYSNVHSAKTCVKCRTSLTNKDAVAPDPADPNHPNRKTVVMAANDEAPWDLEKVAPVQRNRPASGFQTVRRIIPDPNSCCLVAISLDEEKELRKIDLHGDPVPLDRAVLDSGNNSISRSGQATIYEKDGSWYLENMSVLKTTYLQVNQPMKLSDGDIILMGDSLFKFKMGKSDL